MKTSGVLAALLFLLWGCANIYTARGVYHRLQPGETLAGLSREFGVPLQDLAETNDIQDASALRPGRSVFIPGVRAASFRKGRWVSKSKPKGAGTDEAIRTYHGKFGWPVHGKISSRFGVRDGRRHDGIDVRAGRGTGVKAAAAGSVVYSRRLRGYGNIILVKHPENFFTVYAHNSVNLVKKGGKVKKGEVIAKVGSTGRATGPHLHFEIREGTKARNPLFFLPKGG